MNGPIDAEARARIPIEKRWWNKSTENIDIDSRVGFIGPRKTLKMPSKKAVTTIVTSRKK
jgi:hypothetical protein